MIIELGVYRVLSIIYYEAINMNIEVLVKYRKSCQNT